MEEKAVKKLRATALAEKELQQKGPPLVGGQNGRPRFRACADCASTPADSELGGNTGQQPKPGVVRFQEGATTVYLCVSCDGNRHFKPDQQAMQDTLFRDREFFTGGRWRFIDRNQRAEYGLGSELQHEPEELVIFPDQPCACMRSQWIQLIDIPMPYLHVIENGTRQFRAARFQCDGCHDIVDQREPLYCNEAFVPLVLLRKEKSPVKWISKATLARLASMVELFLFSNMCFSVY